MSVGSQSRLPEWDSKFLPDTAAIYLYGLTDSETSTSPSRMFATTQQDSIEIDDELRQILEGTHGRSLQDVIADFDTPTCQDGLPRQHATTPPPPSNMKLGTSTLPHSSVPPAMAMAPLSSSVCSALPPSASTSSAAAPPPSYLQHRIIFPLTSDFTTSRSAAPSLPLCSSAPSFLPQKCSLPEPVPVSISFATTATTSPVVTSTTHLTHAANTGNPRNDLVDELDDLDDERALMESVHRATHKFNATADLELLAEIEKEMKAKNANEVPHVIPRTQQAAHQARRDPGAVTISHPCRMDLSTSDEDDAPSGSESLSPAVTHRPATTGPPAAPKESPPPATTSTISPAQPSSVISPLSVSSIESNEPLVYTAPRPGCIDIISTIPLSQSLLSSRKTNDSNDGSLADISNTLAADPPVSSRGRSQGGDSKPASKPRSVTPIRLSMPRTTKKTEAMKALVAANLQQEKEAKDPLKGYGPTRTKASAPPTVPHSRPPTRPVERQSRSKEPVYTRPPSHPRSSSQPLSQRGPSPSRRSTVSRSRDPNPSIRTSGSVPLTSNPPPGENDPTLGTTAAAKPKRSSSAQPLDTLRSPRQGESPTYAAPTVASSLPPPSVASHQVIREITRTETPRPADDQQGRSLTPVNCLPVEWQSMLSPRERAAIHDARKNVRQNERHACL